MISRAISGSGRSPSRIVEAPTASGKVKSLPNPSAENSLATEKNHVIFTQPQYPGAERIRPGL